MYELEDESEKAAFFEAGSDRAVAVICTAIVENRLTAVLKASMRSDPEPLTELFRPSGPLGSLGTKIRLAYLLGLIHEDIYRDLLLTAKIRNEFAHDVRITSFDDESVKSRVYSLRAFKVWKGDRDRLASQVEGNEDSSFDVRVGAQILRDELSTVRGSFRMCLRFYIWKLVQTEKEALAWMAARPVRTAD
jgi:hypothetical protein